MLCRAGAALLAQLSLAGVLFAQIVCPSGSPPYALLRQDDDNGYLRSPQCRSDFWDQLKYIPLGSNEERFLTIGGEVREWYEGVRNANFGMGDQDGNGYLLQRLTTYADIHLAPRVRVFVQVTSNIEAARNGGPRPAIDESKLFFEQAFADIVLSNKRKKSLVLRLGRQEFKFGSGRFVDVREGTNVRRAFDGVSLKWKTPSWTVDGLMTKPVLNRAGLFDTPPEHGSTFWGAYAVHPLSKFKGANVDLYYLGIARKNAAFEKGTQNELRHTIGARIWGERNGWSYDNEDMFQWGTFGTNRIRAWATTHDMTYRFRSLRLQPQLGLNAGISSGDDGGSKSALGTFNPLFPTGFYFGQGALGLNGPSNLIAAGPHIGLQLSNSVTLIADNHTFWRTSLHDGVYGLGINLLAAGQLSSARHIGNKPTVGVYWNANRHLDISVAFARFLAGPFLSQSSPAIEDVNYAAVWATYRF